MNNKKVIKIFIALLLIAIIIIIAIYIKNKSTNNNLEAEHIQLESTALNVQYTSEELTGEYKNYNAKITLSDENTTIEGSGVSSNQNEIIISQAGSYYITGTISDCSIRVEAGENDDVQLVLDNASITSKTTAPINGVKCNVLTINLMENSQNTLIDSENYTTFTDTESSEPDGTLFTKTDLVINGTGTLTIDSNYLDGIVSKDTLKIINAKIEINSNDDGIRGKDYVTINSANITINAGGDGIKSTNDTDETLGYIAIQGGTYNITATNDGIQAETILNISDNPTINIETTAVQTSNTTENNFQQGPRGMEFQNNTNTSTTEDSVSSKGLKAGKEITIENGKITVNSTDDAIHSNGVIIINNGEFALSSGDDGIHADTNIVINNGNIDISKSYEGIESCYIEINNGTIDIVASDDGINVAGGNDSSSLNGRAGQNNFSNVEDSNRKLVINGGEIEVDASGDGLDANGSIYIYGGNTIVKGPTNSGNGPMDFDGECAIIGGNFIAYGSSGMLQAPSTTSTQNVLVFNASGNSGDTISLKDSSGNEITEFTAEKTYQAIIISNASIEQGETYSLYINNTQTSSLEATSTVTQNMGSGR